MGKFLLGVSLGFVGAAIVKCMKSNTVIEKESDSTSFSFKASFNTKKS